MEATTVDPATLAAIQRAIEDGLRRANADAVPYPWAATVIGFLVLCLGGAVKWGVAESKGRLEDAKAALPLFEKVLEALREAKARGQG